MSEVYRGITARDVARELVVMHLDCCLPSYLEMVRAPLNLADPMVTACFADVCARIDRCLMADARIELCQVLPCSAGAARLLVFCALRDLVIRPALKGVFIREVRFADFDRRNTFNAPGRDIITPDGRLANDWQRIIYAN